MSALTIALLWGKLSIQQPRWLWMPSPAVDQAIHWRLGYWSVLNVQIRDLFWFMLVIACNRFYLSLSLSLFLGDSYKLNFNFCWISWFICRILVCRKKDKKIQLSVLLFSSNLSKMLESSVRNLWKSCNLSLLFLYLPLFTFHFYCFLLVLNIRLRNMEKGISELNLIINEDIFWERSRGVPWNWLLDIGYSWACTDFIRCVAFGFWLLFDIC